MNQSKTKKELEECYDKTKWYINKLASYLSAICGVPAEDLCQEGFLGVVRAKSMYDPSKSSFFTYAQYWIKTYMYSLAYRNAHSIKVPEEFNYIYARYAKMAKNPEIAKRKDKISFIAKEIGVTENRLNRIVKTMTGLKAACTTEDVEATLPDNTDFVSRVLDSSPEMIKLLKETVTEEEYYVINHMLGLEVPTVKTLNWVGNILGVTKERVRQIKNSGLLKFKEAYLDHEDRFDENDQE